MAAAPEGFVVKRRGPRFFYVRGDLEQALQHVGLDDPEEWDRRLAAGTKSPGRGTTATLALPAGPSVLLKRMRRGGWTAAVWRDRFVGRRRLVSNLVLPTDLARRGVATPAPAALLVVRCAPAVYRAWLAMEKVEGARDLLTMFREGPVPSSALAAALDAVRRMHDAGLHHRDLNLGNLLLRGLPGAGWEAFVIDLDRATLGTRPLAVDLRARALLRLERSHEKHIGGLGAYGAGAGDLFCRVYAAGDEALGRRLAAARRRGRFALLLHRLLWRRPRA